MGIGLKDETALSHTKFLRVSISATYPEHSPQMRNDCLYISPQQHCWDSMRVGVLTCKLTRIRKVSQPQHNQRRRLAVSAGR